MMSLSAALCIAAQVVFMGDGFVKGWSDAGKSVWDANFAEGRYVAENLGADGETLASLAKKVADGTLIVSDAKVVVVAAGGEELKEPSLAVYSPLDAILDMQSLLDAIRAKNPSAKIIVSPVFPRGEALNDPERRRGNATRGAFRGFNNAKDVLWCDVTLNLVNADGSRKPELFAGDDRFSAAGYEAWAKELKRFLAFAIGAAKNHPYPQLSNGPMFPENKGLPDAARPYFKRHFLTDKDRRYAIKRAEQRRRARKEYDAVMVGDSITHFWELWNGTPTFNRLFRDKYEMLNLGFGGDNTSACLWTSTWSGLLDGYKAKTVWLMLGTNNFPTNATDEVISDAAQGLKRVLGVVREKHPESKVLLMPALPRGRPKNSPYRAIHEKYNAIIKNYADGNDVIWIGELYGKFIPEDGEITKDILCDGVHPGKEGYRIWGETMLPYMRKYCGDGLKAAAGEAYPVAQWQKSPKLFKMDGTANGEYRAVELFQKEPSPIVVRFAGEAEIPTERATARLSLDVHYATGADPHEWGNRLWLDFSTPGRKERVFTFYPSRPVRHIAAYVNAPASCKPRMEPVVVEACEPAGDAVLDGVPVVGEAPDRAGFYVRDAAAESGYSAISNVHGAKGLKLASTAATRDGATFVTAELHDTTGADRATALLYAVPLPKGELTWFDDIRRSRKADSAKRTEFCNVLGGESARGPLSRWPIAAVDAGGRGVAIGVDPELPGFYRLALNPRLRVLHIVYDIGLAAPEKPSGKVGFVVFTFDAKDGMRGALERYQSLFPEHHRDRAKPHGLWSAFYKLSSVTNVHDLGFRYNESGRELAWDDANDILSLRYREPCTWWMQITRPDGSSATYDECITKAKDELAKGVPDARAWETSVFKDERGWPVGSMQNKSWCNGIAWSMNAAPGIPGFSEFLFKQGSAEDCAKRYSKPKPAGWDGEYIDSAELARTAHEDFDRRHFAAMRTPLVFSSDRKTPCVYSGLCVQEYMAEVHRRMLAADRISLANATPYHWSWLVPQTDVAGYEIYWGAGGKWKPDSEEQLAYWRALAGIKPYCFLMDIPGGGKFTPEMTERYFKTSLAYGFLPGFQSSLFKTGMYERDRELFKRYVPLCKLVSEAGWRPVNRILSTKTAGIRVEQFGERYVTVFNHGSAAATAELELLPGIVAANCEDLVARRTHEFADGVAKIALGPGDVALLEVAGRKETLSGFNIELFDGKTGTVVVSSCDFRPPNVKRSKGRTHLVWKGHPRLGDNFTATADGVEKDGATEWTFSCYGNASGLPIGRIAFPVMDVPCADDGHLLYSPFAGGGTMGWKIRVIWKDMPVGKKVCSTMSPGFRFVAVLNGESRDSYYFDVRDPASNSGQFEVGKGPGGTARLAWVHDMPMTAANATGCRLPYAATIRPYRGDWFEAVAFYRDWAKTTPRYAAAKARDLSKLRDIGLWMWNRGLAETVIPPVERFQSDTGLKVALDWYWWFKEMPGTFYPDYWPPREGVENFKAAVRRLKAMGAFTQVYLNGMTWDEDMPSWKEGGLDSVAMRRDGTYFSYAYNRFNPNHRLANLCGEAPKFHSRIREQSANLVDCGFDSIYLDMIGCNAYGPCFNPAHRHAPGGGTHMTDDFRAYLKGVKKAHPGILLSTEDCGEAYLDVFDSNISTHSSYERHGWIGTAPNVEFVPVFQAVYHGCAAVFGNYAIVDNVPYWDPRWPMKAWWTGHEEHLRKDYPDQFAVEFSRGPAWGLQPSVHNFWLHHATNAAFAAEYRFIRETAKFYHDNRAFLFDGEMLHPGKLECKRLKVDFAKVSVFDKKVASHASTLPAVFHNVWRAPDGRVAAILVNWSCDSQSWKLESPDVSGAGVLAPRSWVIVAKSPIRGESF